MSKSDLEDYLQTGDRTLLIPAWEEYKALQTRMESLKKRPISSEEVMEGFQDILKEGDRDKIAVWGSEVYAKLDLLKEKYIEKVDHCLGEIAKELEITLK